MIKTSKAGRYFGLIAVMLFLGLLAPYAALAGSSSAATVWLSSPGNFGQSTGSNNAQKYAVIFYNPSNTSITVSQVDITDSDTTGYWSTVTTPASSGGTWSIASGSDIRWTGTQSVGAQGEYVFYCTVYGSSSAPGSWTAVTLSATVTDSKSNTYSSTGVTNATVEGAGKAPTTVNGYFAASTADNSASPLYVLTNGGTPYAGGATVNFDYQLWSLGNNGTYTRYIYGGCGTVQVVITLPSGWGTPTNITVPSIFNTPVVTTDGSGNEIITITQNATAAMGNFNASVLNNITFQATAPNTYTATTASPITATYGGGTSAVVESTSNTSCSTSSYTSPVNAVSNMAVMVAAGSTYTPVNVTGITAGTPTDTTVPLTSTFTGDQGNQCTFYVSPAGAGTYTAITGTNLTETTGQWTETATGLTPGTAYDFEAVYTDSNTSVTGSPATTASSVSTTYTGTTPGTVTASSVADTSLTATVTYNGDSGNTNTCALTTSPAGGTVTPTAQNTTSSPKTYTYSVTGLTPGTAYTLTATFGNTTIEPGATNPISASATTTYTGTTPGTVTPSSVADTSLTATVTYNGDSGNTNTCALTTSPAGGTITQTGHNTTSSPKSYTYSVTGLAPGTAYTLTATFGSTTIEPGATNPISASATTTYTGITPGTITIGAVTDTTIPVSVGFQGDTDSNAGVSFQYSTNPSGPWSSVTGTRGTNSYTATITGLSPGTPYYVQAVFTDEAIYGSGTVTYSSNPVTTTYTGTTPGTITPSSIANTSFDVTVTYTGDTDNNNTCALTVSPSGGTITQTAHDTTSNPKSYTYSVTGLAQGTQYTVSASFTDSSIDGSQPTPVNVTTTVNTAVTTPVSLTAPTIGDTFIGIDTTYSGGSNNNNTCTITSSGGTVVHPAAVNYTLKSYTTTITGLQRNTSYTVFAHYTGVDGVTQPSTLSTTFTTTYYGITPGAIATGAATDTTIPVSVGFQGDTDSNATVAFQYRTDPSGTWYSVAGTRGANSYTATITGLSPNTLYDIQAVFTDESIYGSGTVTSSPVMTAGPTKMGTATAVVNSSTQITVFSNFSGDASDSTTAIAYGTSPTSFPNTAPGSPVGGSSPRSSIITGLTTGTPYYFQITYTNSTYGVTTDTGITNPLVIGPYTPTAVCQSEITSCTDCHSLPPNEGSHQIPEHEGKATRSACAVCHFNYKTMTNVTSPRWTVGHFDNTMHIYTSSHINGGIKGGYYMGLRNRSSLWAGGTENANTTYECTATYCHGQSNSPQWGTTGITCTACHDAPPTAGSHGMHNQGYIGYADNSNGTLNYDFGCFKCHPKSTHAQGPATSSSAAFVGPFSDISSPVTLGGTYANGTSSQTDSRGFEWSDATCTNLYCHSNGQTGETGAKVVYATPKWGNNTISCTSCHGQADTVANMTSSTTNHLSSSHAMHAANDRYQFPCAQCHNETVSSSNSISNTALHVNGVRDVHITSPSSTYTNWTGPFNSSTNLCSNVYCHSNGNGGPPNVTPQWGVTVTNCASCHNYKAPFAVMSTGQHKAHVNSSIAQFDCYQCHSETVDSNDQIIYANKKHVNGVKDVHINGFNGISGVYDSTTKTCSGVFCHSSGQPVSTTDPTHTPVFHVTSSWTRTVTYNCKSCHGSNGTSKFGEPDYANNSTVGRAFFNGHGEPGHVSAASDCANCHSGVASVHTVNGFATITSQTQHITGTVVVKFRSDIQTGGATWDPITKTCSNVPCHGPNSGTLRWGGHGNCQACHGVNSNTEVDNFNFNNGIEATISMLQYTSVGHGKTGTYAYSGNTGANLQCTNCHTESVAHNDAKDPFRLISSATQEPSQPDTICLYCHNSGIEVHNFHNASTVYSGGVNPTWLFTPKCVDCHDPHGDMGPNGRYNAYMMQSYVNYTAGSNVFGQPSTAYAPYRKALNFPADAVAKSYLTMTSFATPSYNGLCQICHTRGISTTGGTKFPAHYNRAMYGPASGDSMQGVCTQCHSHSSGFKGAGGDCTQCHTTGGSPTVAGRRNVMIEFENSSSHHVVGTPTKFDCAACHAEGNYADGSMNSTYHTFRHGAPVFLKVWTGQFGTGSFNVISTMPTSNPYFDTTKLTPFCLGCHNDANDTATPFSDGLNPNTYAWDNNSIASKYNNISTTPWGKFNSTLYNVVPADVVTKAYSPHGNPGKNKSVMSIATFFTYSSTKAVACLDCHNAHASNVSGGTSYKSKNPEGGILNSYSTAGGKLRWRPTRFTPTEGGSSSTKNMYSASSDLCFSCHNGDNPAIAKNYSSFGLKRGMTIAGSYYDRVGNTKVWTNWSTTRWSTNDVWRGSFAYKDAPFQGGHFGNSLGYLQEGMTNMGSEKNLGRALVNSQGYGNCTACHDPHGVSTDWTTGSYSRPVRTLAMSNATSIPSVSISSYSGTNTGIYVVQATGANTYQVSGDGGKTWTDTNVSTGTQATQINGVAVTLPSTQTYATDDTWTFIVGYSYITKQYMIPALKGTWMHSPYKEDRAPRNSYTTDLGPNGATTARLAGINNANDVSSYNPSTMPGRLWDDITGGTSTATSNRGVGGPAPRANPDFKAGSYVPGYNAVAIQGDGFGRGPNMGTSYLYGTGYKNISSLKGWNGYFIDENTFGTSALKGYWGSNYNTISSITMTDANPNATPGNFSGLCLQCHAWSRNSGIALNNVTSSTIGTGAQHITTKPHETVSGMGSITVDLFRREVDYNGGSWQNSQTSRAQGDIHNLANLSRGTDTSTAPHNGPAGQISNSGGTIYTGAADTTADSTNQGYSHYYRWGVNPGDGSHGGNGEGVVGWVQSTYHKFPCAKCHTPHVARLPRLMKTNCLDNDDLTKTGATGGAHTTQAYATQTANSPNAAAGMGALYRNMACHSTKIQSWDGTNQTWESGGGWNNKTPW